MSTTCLKSLLEIVAQTVAAPDTQADLMEGSDGNDTGLMVGGAGNGSEEVAMKIIASCANKERATGRFDTQKRAGRRAKQIHSHYSGTAHARSVLAHSVRPAGRKGQGRRMGSAQAISIQATIK